MSPPKLARWFLRATLSADQRDDVLANLEELYRFRRQTHGVFAANLWYWKQALSFSLHLRWFTRRSPVEPPRRSVRSSEMFMQFVEDLSYAVRSFRRSPGFLFAAVATLALGFGANAVIFAVVDAAVLRPLPFPNAERLVWVWPRGEIPLTYRQFRDLQAEVKPVADLSAVAFRSYAIAGGDAPGEVSGASVSTNHFDVFGVQPILGRNLLPEDGVLGTDPVAAISYELWQSHFGGDSAVVGQRVNLFTSASIPMVPGAFTGAPHTVIAVLPPRYRPFGYQAHVYTPLVPNSVDPNLRSLTVVARLAPGATAERVQDELIRLGGTLPSLRPMEESIKQDGVVGLREALIGHLRPVMFLTLGAVGMVLLIACANVANLVLARTQSRRQELGVRYALGASRGRIARQLLTESLVLSGMAATVGVLAARVSLPTVVSLLPPHLVAADSVALNLPVLVFTLAALVVTAVLSGIGPSIRHTNALDGISGSQRAVGSSPHRHLVNNGLVVTEIALALVLAYGAGLLLKSFSNLTGVDVGFETENVMTLRVAPSEQQYRDTAVRRNLFGRVLEQFRAVPGVEAAGAIHFLPIGDGGPSVGFLMDPSDPQSSQTGSYRIVTPGYLETMKIPLLQGREVDVTDDEGSTLVGWVNRRFAESLWPGEDAVGRAVYRTSGRVFFTVAGVVGDVRQSALGLPPHPEIYLPLAQSQWASAMTIVVRTAGSVPGLESQLRRIVRTVDPNLPITRLASMEAIVSDSLADQRFYGVLFSLFAGLALVLGGIGIYGVVSYVMGQRTNEIGIRLALGATQRGILRREIGRGAVVIGTGIVLGVVTALALTRFLTSLLYEVSVFDPIVFGTAASILATVALLGVALPARRAARIDPIIAIRGAE